MGRVIFVSGTDTGVGKTWVSRGILHGVRRAQKDLFPLKLVETGCERRGQELIGADGQLLAGAAGCPYDERVAPYRYELPASPRLAAERAAQFLDFDTLVSDVQNRARDRDVLVEGAGGLMVPLCGSKMFVDLAVAIGGNLVLVSRDALGTINHTLLSVAVARHHELTIAAVILNAAGATPCGLDNLLELRRCLPDLPVFGTLPWLEEATNAEISSQLEALGVPSAAWCS